MKIPSLLMGSMVSVALAASAQTPLLQYSFDEASGDALDSGSGVASPGTLQGGAARTSNTPSGTGSAIDFTTENTYAHVLSGDAAKLDGLGQITLTTWLNVSTYTSGNHRLMSKQAGGTFGGFSWNMNATPNDGTVGPDNFRLGLFLGNNVSSGAGDFGFVYSSADVGAANQWVFLAVTYDGSLAADNVRFFIGDGDSAVTQVGNAMTLPQMTIDGGTSRFGVGFTDAAPTANTSVIGYQDDVRVYGEALGVPALDAIRLQAVPEPSALGLLAIGALALVGFRKVD